MKMTLWRVLWGVALASATLAVGCGGADEVGGDVNNAANNNTGSNNASNNVFNNNTNNATVNNTTGSNNATANNNAPVSCGEHAVGERWPAEDGCNTCTCTEGGQAACTEIACADSCEELRADYQAAIQGASACVANDDCAILNGQCGVGLGGCYASANASLSQEELNALGASFSEQGCTSAVCDCGPPQPPACIEGVCGFLDALVSCGEHAVGERWLAEDGCNTCTCTEDGQEACTEIACVDSCEDLRAGYQAAIEGASACVTNDDCIILNGQCGVGLGGCYASANASLSQEELNALGASFSEQGCTSAVCDCAPPPASACVEGVCGFQDAAPVSCGEHAVGESWLADDGCNTCTCTEGGLEACTDRACVDSCEEIVDRYRSAVTGAKACAASDECQLLYGQCGVGLGGCYEAVNTSLTQDELSALGGEFSGAGCIAGVCSCTPPPAVGCVEGLCDFVVACGEYAVGESWLADDGCNTCTCTEGGLEACTDRACTVCQTVELRYRDLLETHQTCQADDECQVLSADCSINGTCWTAANLGVTQDQLRELSEQFDAESCDGPVCRCPVEPEGAVCDAGRCALR